MISYDDYDKLFNIDQLLQLGNCQEPMDDSNHMFGDPETHAFKGTELSSMRLQPVVDLHQLYAG